MPEVGTFLVKAGSYVKGALAAKGAAATIGQKLTAFAIKAALFTGTSYGLSAISAKKLGSSSNGMASALDNTIDSMPAVVFAYGETRIGSTLIFHKELQTYDANRDSKSKKNQVVHMVFEICNHSSESIDQIYFKDTALNLVQATSRPEDYLFPDMGNGWGEDSDGVPRYIPDGTVYDKWMMIKIHKGDQLKADADLMDAMYANDLESGWTDKAIGQNTTYVYIRCLYKPMLFRGIPEFSFYGRWKNDILDIRDDSIGYTSNPILCTRDYMATTKLAGGFGLGSREDFNETIANASSNTCDEAVTVFDDGTQQTRYFLGGMFKSSQEPHQIISDMLATCAGWYEWINGQWWLFAGEQSAPTMTLTESELLDWPSWQLNRSAKEAINSIKPVLRSEETTWYPSNVESVEALNKKFCDTATDTFTSRNAEGTANVNHNLEVGDRLKARYWTGVKFDDSFLPSALVGEFYYHVVEVPTSTTFKISILAGGSPLTVGSTTGRLVLFHDVYLSKDVEREATEVPFSMVNDATLARRLSIIELRKARQEMSGINPCKVGTPYACPFDLVTGDTVRIIDNDMSTWTVINSASTPDTGENVINDAAHTFIDGSPVVVLDSDSSGLDESRPYYVITPTASGYQLADYRGGPPVEITSGASIEIQEVEGKLFRVVDWQFHFDDGLPWVQLGLRETATNIYDWTNDREVDPENAEGITVNDIAQVETPANVVIETGTAALYLQADGTVVSRVKVTCDEAKDSYILESGRLEILYSETGAAAWLSIPPFPGGSTEVYFTGPEDGIFYDFRLRFANVFGFTSDWVTIENVEMLGKTDPPSAVTGLSFEDYDDNSRTLPLTWNAVTDLDLDHYNIYRAITPTVFAPETSEYDLVGQPAKDATRFVDTGIWANGQDMYFHYIIESVDTSKNKTYTNTWEGDRNRTVIEAPAAPSLTVTAPSEGLRIQATWASTSAYDDMDLEVIIYPAEANGKDKAIPLRYRYGDEKFIYLFQPGSAGTYRLEAVRVAKLKAGKVISEKFTSGIVTITEDTVAPDAPASISAVYVWATNSVALEIDAVEAIDLAGYVIERKKGSEAYEKIHELPADQDSSAKPKFIDTGVFSEDESGTTYTYRVKTFDQSGNISAGVTDTVTLTPDDPPTVTIGVSDDGPAITLAWNNSNTDIAAAELVFYYGPNESGWKEGDSKRFVLGTGAKTGRILISNDHEKVTVTNGFKVAHYLESGSTGAPRKSKFSSETTVTVPADETPPPGLNSFTASFTARGTLLTMSPSRTIDLHSIEIERKYGSAGTWEKIDEVGRTFAYLDSSIPPNTDSIDAMSDFYYRAREKDKAGNVSGYSTASAFGLRTAPSSGIVTDAAITAYENSIGDVNLDVEWLATGAATGVYIEVYIGSSLLRAEEIRGTSWGFMKIRSVQVSSSTTFSLKVYGLDIYGNASTPDTDSTVYTP